MAFRDPVGAHRNAGAPVAGGTWGDRRIRNDDVAGVIVQDCVFERVRLEHAVLRQTMFPSCRFDDCVFDDCRIVDTRWIGCTGSGMRISCGDLSRALLSPSRLSRVAVEQAGHQLVLAESELDRFEAEKKPHTVV